MAFSGNTRVKEIAVANPGAKKVLEDAGVDYCCGGERRLHDACMKAGVSAEEILQRLQENSKQVSAEEKNWTAATLCELTQHIVAKHHGYVREQVPRLRALLDNVKSSTGKTIRNLRKSKSPFSI